jgi:NADPH:quinone reductase-like Zn-dependent oxidoreductase
MYVKSLDMKFLRTDTDVSPSFSFGLQFAVASGATVVVTSSSDEKLALAKKLGAKHVINYKKTPNWEEEVLKVTNGHGVDFTVEVGGAETFEKAMACSAWGGVVSLIGWVSGMSSSNTTGGAIGKALTIRGIQVGSVELFEKMARLISANPDTTRPVVDKVFELKDLQAAFAHLESQKHVGKIVVKFTE